MLTERTEEHHINSFDAGAFFNLHDYDSTNEWTPDDILKTYGERCPTYTVLVTPYRT